MAKHQPPHQPSGAEKEEAEPKPLNPEEYLEREEASRSQKRSLASQVSAFGGMDSALVRELDPERKPFSRGE